MTAESYLRFPHVRGDRLVFVAENDIWTVGTGGGRAYRVSSDGIPAKSPRLSPLGTSVAWTAGYPGANEVHVAPADGGPSRRLTFWGQDRTFVRGWLSESEVLVLSSTGQAERQRMFAHAVPVDGGPSRRLVHGWAHDLALGPDGGVLISTSTTSEPAWWKHYRGGTAAQLWLDRSGNGDFRRILGDLSSSLVSPVWVGGEDGDRIGFLSDHEGRGQLYSVGLDDVGPVGEPVRHTDHEFYARHASSDGYRVAYVSGGQVWLLDSLDPGTAPARIPIRLGGSRPLARPRLVKAADDLAAVRPDRVGDAGLLESRGTITWLSHRDGPARALAGRSGERNRLPTFLGSGGAAWITDAQGDDAVVALDLTDPAARPRVVLAAGEGGRILELAASPDGKSLALATHDGRLLVVPTGDETPADTPSVAAQLLHRTEFGDLSGLSWSPDSNWLVWSEPAPAELRQIRMGRPADGAVIEVTPVRFKDTEPCFTTDGKYIAFLSVRIFDPVDDAVSFDLSFPQGCRPQLVALDALTPAPFGPRPQGRGWDRTPAVEDETPVTAVDVEGLSQRVIPLPVEGSRYERLRAVEGGLVWLKRPLAGELGEDRAKAEDSAPSAVLERFSFLAGTVEQLAEKADGVEVSGDGKRLVVSGSDALTVIPSTAKVDAASPDRVEVDLGRVRIEVEPAAEWRQMYHEAWRLMRDHFWRPDMGGLDWPAMGRRYETLLPALGSHDDLVDLIWELQGELGTSHAYCLPKPEAGSHPKQGLLGADLSFGPDGWVIDRLIPGEPSDRRARSPLTAPGVGARVGEVITAVGGVPTSATAGPNALLLGSANTPVELVLQPVGGQARRVVVVPLGDEFPLRYQDWVNDRRAHVHRATDGRIGYLHIPDMVSGGWAQFHRDLPLEMRRQALIVDVRGNRGGYTSQLVIEKLARRVIGWGLGRGFAPESYPMDARRGPLVAVADMHSGSDGDIVTAAIKALKLGPVVGNRTWGGVIGIDMRYHLIDGTLVTQPRYATWFEDDGWGVENYGVDPDIEVVPSPLDRASGNDVELDTAIEVALDLLRQTPAKTPPVVPTD
ncbi:peptidase S41 [Nakamurella silvestris]|nr:peptidase S41 [Nakamurella silvestris]